jgi:hypothetical protein
LARPLARCTCHRAERELAERVVLELTVRRDPECPQLCRSLERRSRSEGKEPGVT